MSLLEIPDLLGKSPKVIVVLEKPDITECQKQVGFVSTYQAKYLKEFITRGFKQDDLIFAYVKSEVEVDEFGNPKLEISEDYPKGQIIVTEQDKEEFVRRLYTYLSFYDVEHIILAGERVKQILVDKKLCHESLGYESLETFELPDVSVKLHFLMTIDPQLAYLSITNRERLIKALDTLYTTMFGITSVDNASYVSIDMFTQYLRKCMAMYDSGLINSIGFDLETNCTDWYEHYSKICLISASDRISNHAFSCATYHPEKVMSHVKRRLWKWFFSVVTEKKLETSAEYNILAEKLKRFTKIFPLIEKEPYMDVPSENEFKMMDMIPQLCKVWKTLPKKTEKSEAINLAAKHAIHEEFFTSGKAVIDDLKYLLTDSIYEQKIQYLWQVMNEALSRIPVIGHNVKFDIGFCAWLNIGKRGLRVAADTFGQALLLFGQVLGESNNLEVLSVKHLGIENKWKSAFHSHPRLKKGLKGGTERFDRVPLSVLGPYSAADAIATDLLEEKFSKELKGTQLELLDREQDLAVTMFSLGEIHGFSVFPQECKLMFKFVKSEILKIEDFITNMKCVKQFEADMRAKLPEKEAAEFKFNLNTTGAQSHKAAILFRNEYFGLSSVASTEAGYPSTDMDALQELSPLIKRAIREYDESDGKKKVFCLNNNREVTAEYYEKLVEVDKFLDNLMKYSGYQQLYTMYYAISYDEKNDRSRDKFIAVFKLIGATKTGRLSSRFHLAPKTGGVRYIYCSAWAKDSIRKYTAINPPGRAYEPYYGGLDVTYEDGTTEYVTFDELIQRGYSQSEIAELIERK